MDTLRDYPDVKMGQRGRLGACRPHKQERPPSRTERLAREQT